MSVRSAGRSAGSGFLSQPGEDDLIEIHGVAMGSGDITRGHLSEEEKLWRPDVLREAAYTLAGQQIVVDHQNKEVDAVVGQITDAAFEEGTGVIYQGVINDEDLAEKIGYGWIDVSPRILHSEESDEVKGVKAPRKIVAFDNLSLVTRGASASNEVDLGEHEELSAEELQQAFDNAPEIEGVVEEYQVGEDYVREYQSKEDVADVYSEELQEKEIDANLLKWIFDNKEGARGASQSLGCSGFHDLIIDEQEIYLPCDDRDTFLKNFVQADENMDEMPDPEEFVVEEAEEEGDSGNSNNSGESKMTEDENSGFELSEPARKLGLIAEMEDAPISELSVYRDSDVSEKDERIAELEEDLDERDERIEELEESVEEKDGEIEELQDDVEEVEELQEEVDTVKEAYSESLAVEGRFEEEELMEKYEASELREKYEAALEDEDTEVDEVGGQEPDPGSTDTNAGKQSAEGETTETAELSEEEEELVSEMSEAGGAWADISEEVEEELSAAE